MEAFFIFLKMEELLHNHIPPMEETCCIQTAIDRKGGCSILRRKARNAFLRPALFGVPDKDSLSK